MSRIPTPESIKDAPKDSQGFLDDVQIQLGSVPNLFRIISNSPVALEGYLGLNSVLGRGELESETRERIALAVAEINGCGYCLAAHSYLGKNLAGLSDVEMTANRKGRSTDAKADAAVRFAAEIAEKRGQVMNDTINAVKAAGYSNAEIVEIIAHVALNSLTNYMNEALGTEIDFPPIQNLAA